MSPTLSVAESNRFDTFLAKSCTHASSNSTPTPTNRLGENCRQILSPTSPTHSPNRFGNPFAKSFRQTGDVISSPTPPNSSPNQFDNTRAKLIAKPAWRRRRQTGSPHLPPQPSPTPRRYLVTTPSPNHLAIVFLCNRRQSCHHPVSVSRRGRSKGGDTPTNGSCGNSGWK